MRKSGLSVAAAALLSAIFAASIAAQDFDRNSPAAPLAISATTNAQALAGNPLWAIALDELSETKARPLFSPSRRPLAPPVLAAATAVPVRPKAASKAQPDHPLLTLLGTVVGDSVEIGVFADEASHDVIRLKAGELHDGWTLSAVSGRAATFDRQGSHPATLSLPAPSATADAPGIAAGPSGGNAPIKFAPPVSTFVPAKTEGGSRRPPKEG